MEKIELHKRTLRTLSLSELELIGGASEDGDEAPENKDPESPDGAAKPKPPAPPKPSTLSSDCPCFSVEICPPKSKICPPTANLACCPASSD